ncbi:Probable E3 ubiquitin-protein ligase HERC6 (HECT domain and RCC1-like domain-containing protein 6) (HECT-type E3 ubiquitin transferase HERC6) [Durusdinium trenchii]|uniref:Probable E3 ubiquitin-protein ligase HERC6 (HECT domain and RCC1-like domain-containing protein 6) (HECT-type E3 ubiquitin transferase HERC6) n=1 Tax=Durusdinium trenchii TaxID=1381693 RepID=A0ABP0KSI0_9DINO
MFDDLGPNEAYQCGLPEDSLVKSLTRLKVPKEEPLVQVEFGEFHGVGLTASGHVLRWGQEQGPDVPLARQALDDPKTRGYLPKSINLNQPSPMLLECRHPVKFVAAGGYHSALVTTCGQLYLWGSNSYGQLGLGLKRDELAFVGQPRPVDVEGALSVGDVSHASPVVAGVSLGGLHSAFLDVQGAVYTFGDNRRGQCGQGEVTQLSAPERLQELPRADGVSCGGFFSFFQVADDLYACGWGKEGCLGFGQLCKKQLRVRRVPPPQRGGLHRRSELLRGVGAVAVGQGDEGKQKSVVGRPHVREKEVWGVYSKEEDRAIRSVVPVVTKTKTASDTWPDDREMHDEH